MAVEDRARSSIAAGLKAADTGEGVLILTDMFGGTPSNMSLSFHDEHQVEVVTGMNLPMLIKLATLARCPSHSTSWRPSSRPTASAISQSRVNSCQKEIAEGGAATRRSSSEFTVRAELGLHARPAGRLASLWRGASSRKSRWAAVTSG